MGRVFGAFGHANDTGSLIVCVLPAMIAMMITSQGGKRIMWFGCMMASALVLILTVSRGAFVGLFVGTMWGAWLCRRYVPVQRLAMFGVVAIIGVVLATRGRRALLDPQIGNVISERLFGQSKAYDMGEASSGRTAIWAEAISPHGALADVVLSAASAGTCTRSCRSATRRITTISACGSTSASRACALFVFLPRAS